MGKIKTTTNKEKRQFYEVVGVATFVQKSHLYAPGESIPESGRNQSGYTNEKKYSEAPAAESVTDQTELTALNIDRSTHPRLKAKKHQPIKKNFGSNAHPNVEEETANLYGEKPLTAHEIKRSKLMRRINECENNLKELWRVNRARLEREIAAPKDACRSSRTRATRKIFKSMFPDAKFPIDPDAWVKFINELSNNDFLRLWKSRLMNISGAPAKPRELWQKLYDAILEMTMLEKELSKLKGLHLRL